MQICGILRIRSCSLACSIKLRCITWYGMCTMFSSCCLLTDYMGLCLLDLDLQQHVAWPPVEGNTLMHCVNL